jgi:signal-transduction protein with cAMP-binding, CBS, and nucleotidyltransferase domain
MANTVNEIMTRNPAVLSASSTVEEAARIMRDRYIGDIIVSNDKNSQCGIVTDRDLVVRVLASGKDPKKTKLDSICSWDITALRSTESTDDAVRLMREKAIRRLPVIDDGKVVGVVSLGDLAQRLDQNSVLGEISAASPNR